MAREKFRIRFKKVGDLRMISHHDLMRCFERMLRRAALPFRSTEGFNPKPKMAFALSLALGIEGWEEVVELELESPDLASQKEPVAKDADPLARRAPKECPSAVRRADDAGPLAGSAREECAPLARPASDAGGASEESPSRPANNVPSEGIPSLARPANDAAEGGPIISSEEIPSLARPANDAAEGGPIISEEDLHHRLAAQAPAGLQFLSVRRIEPRVKAQPRRAVYQIDLPADRCHGVLERIIAVLAESETWVERMRPEARRVNIRPYLRELRLDGITLEMDLWVTPTGTARPDDILGLLELGDLLASGAVLRRTLLELHDESADSASLPPGMDAPASVGAAPVE